MFQISISSAVRSTTAAAMLIGVIVVALAARGASPAELPLGRADDYGTRHLPAVTLSVADDFGTRHIAPLVLDERDDYATRQAGAATLTEADDYGTRHGGR